MAGDTERADRINTAHSYYATYLRYICRHLYPYTIHNKVKIGKSKKEDLGEFTVRNFNKILMRNSSIGRSTSISHNVFVGLSSKIGD